MNKQEAIELLRDVAQRVFYRTGRRSIHIDKIVELVNQIDEPQKVIIPKFVADWLEYCKIAYRDLQMALSGLDHDRKVGDWVYDENGDLIPEKVDMIARAWLDGYEIEKEKLYTVEILNPNIIGNEHTVLVKNGFKEIVMVRVYGDNWRTAKGYQLTEAEIKQDFEWAWDAGFAKEVD